MIQIIPSILIRKGKIVKQKQNDHSQETDYEKNPVDLSLEYEDHGIEVVHLVDLDGEERGAPINYHVLEAITGHTKLKVDFTGGITTDGDINKAYEYGASYITAATIAAYQPDLFASWIISYGREKMTLGADSMDGKIAIKGWIKKTQIDLFEHIRYFYDRGLKYVKTTDISRNGLLEGPSFDLYKKIIDSFPGIQVLACGGVRNFDDIEELNKIGVFAVIIGKAFYEGKITLDEVLKFSVNQE